MKAIMTVILASLAIIGCKALFNSNYELASVAGHSAACQEFFSSSQLQFFLKRLADIKKEQPPAGQEFLVTTPLMPFGLLNPESPRCAVLHLSGDVLEFSSFQDPLELKFEGAASEQTPVAALKHEELRSLIRNKSPLDQHNIDVRQFFFIDVTTKAAEDLANSFFRLTQERGNATCEAVRSCSEFKDYKTTKLALEDLDNISRADLWPDNRFLKGTVDALVLSHPNFCNCALLYSNQKVLDVLTMAKPFIGISFDAPAFSWVGAGYEGDNKGELAAALAKHGIAAEKTQLYFFSDNYSQVRKRKLHTIPHEDFHAFHQSSPAVWKSSGVKDKNRLSSLCYVPNPTVAGLFQRESQALAATLGGVVRGNLSEAVAQASEYLSLRQQRYRALGSARVEDNGGSILCEQAELEMEKVEGTATYVGREAQIATRIFDRKGALQNEIDTLQRYAQVPDAAVSGDVFYATGAAQLYLIQALRPGEFRNIQKSIGLETANAGINYWLQRVVAEYRQ